MKVINFFGAPCAGKSTAASGLFNIMKRTGYRCEYVTEVAKDYIYSGSSHILADQMLIFAQQAHKVDRLLNNEIDYAITDSPLLFSSFYAAADYPASFHELCMDFFNKHENINIFVHRSHDYNMLGRVHDESQSDLIAKKMHDWLINNGVKFVDISSKTATAENLFSYISVLEDEERGNENSLDSPENA